MFFHSQTGNILSNVADVIFVYKWSQYFLGFNQIIFFITCVQLQSQSYYPLCDK